MHPAELKHLTQAQWSAQWYKVRSAGRLSRPGAVSRDQGAFLYYDNPTTISVCLSYFSGESVCLCLWLYVVCVCVCVCICISLSLFLLVPPLCLPSHCKGVGITDGYPCIWLFAQALRIEQQKKGLYPLSHISLPPLGSFPFTPNICKPSFSQEVICFT